MDAGRKSALEQRAQVLTWVYVMVFDLWSFPFSFGIVTMGENGRLK